MLRTEERKKQEQALQAGAQRLVDAHPQILTASAAASPELTVWEDIKSLLPVLSKEERSALEASILREGCLDPLKVMSGCAQDGTPQLLLVDGHNRYEICRKHNIPFNVVDVREPVEMVRNDIKIWVVKNQLGRRNLTDAQRTEYIGRLYNMKKLKEGNPTAAIAKNRPNGPKNQLPQNEGVDNSAKNEVSKNGSDPTRVGDLVGKYLSKPIPDAKESLINSPSEKVVTAVAQAAKSTAEKIAKEQGVSRATVERAAKFVDGLDRVEAESPAAAAKIRNETSVLTRGEVRALADAPEEAVKEAVKAIEEGRPLPPKEDSPPKSKSNPAAISAPEEDGDEEIPARVVSRYCIEMGESCRNLAAYMMPDRITELPNLTMEFVIRETKSLINDLNVFHRRATIIMEKRGGIKTESITPSAKGAKR